MAEQGRTVRVTGLPTKIQKERLEDKLCIHFQRGSNGGGEVVLVSTVKTSADYALITFEDSRVAQRVIQHNQHILEVDGERFNLTVKEHPADLHQDKIIIKLSATVDCSQLPAARKTLKALNKNHPDVQIDHTSARGLCILTGSYSSVQAALAQLLGQNELPQTPQNTELTKSIDNQPNHPSLQPLTQVLHDQSRVQKDKREKPLVEKHTSSSQRDLTPGGYEWEAQGATASPPGFEEDFSLMVDADMFQYLQKYCSEEYHQILRRHGVAVVDYTHQGLTTLLLQVASGDGKHEQECLRKAKEEITRLYDSNQANVCRDKLSKAILPQSVALKRAIDKLSGKFPKLLVSEDELSVYLIGSRDDVGEARKFLLFHDHNEEDKAEVTSPRRFQDSWPVGEVKAPGASPGILESNGLDQPVDESRLDVSPKVKLAAQFNKDSRLAPIGSKSSNFTVRGQTQSKTRTRQGPMLGYDVLSDTKGGVSVNPQNTNGDATMDARPKTTPVNLIQSESLPTPSPPNASGSSLRRSSSFSGVPQKKEQEISPKSDTETGKSRGRSSSFSSGSKQEQHSAQVIVNTIIWLHLTKAYKPRMVELTSEIQMTEKDLERSKDCIILLTGTNSSKVAACQEDLQKLIDSVSVDFICRSIPLSDLGVTDGTDEALQACCAEIHSLYKKISIEITDKSLYLLGPEVLCSQVFKLLCEVFAGAQHSIQDHSRPSTSGRSGVSPNPQINGANGQVSQRKEAVVREKVKLPSSMEKDGQSVQESITKASVNGSDKATAAVGGAVCEACGRAGAAVKKALCGVTICRDCLVTKHSQCRVCERREEPKAWGVQGKMTYASLPMSLPGHNRDPTIKITYSIPDGIQGEKHPSPGKPFTGGVFEAYLPDCEQTRKLLPRLQEALRRGHTFTVTPGGKAFWDIIPHKTSLHGGRSASAYPDLSYLNRLSDILTSLGI